jgi:peroxin-5
MAASSSSSAKENGFANAMLNLTNVVGTQSEQQQQAQVVEQIDDRQLMEEMLSSLGGLKLSPSDAAQVQAAYNELHHGVPPASSSLGQTGDAPSADDAYALDDDFAADWTQSFWANQASANPMPSAATRGYQFSEENPFMGIDSSASVMEAGIKLFGEGRLDEAVLAFEAVVRGDGASSSDAWRWLGTAHAENDDDQVAIMCLEKSLAADADNLEALLDLGVSYTNELFHDEALRFLESWLQKHPAYASIPALMPADHDADAVAAAVPSHLAASTPAAMSSKRPSGRAFQSRHDRVVAMFKRAAAIDAHDPDVHTVLGVLYNLSREYELAEHAFAESLRLDGSNYSLWNKLGATQANSTRADGSKQAVTAYRRAIELKPTYTRAWVNMGISYSNQGLYDLAAKYYLKALSLNESANHVWAYLRIALQCMNRDDLAALVHQRQLDLFRNDFAF